LRWIWSIEEGSERESCLGFRVIEAGMKKVETKKEKRRAHGPVIAYGGLIGNGLSCRQLGVVTIPSFLLQNPIGLGDNCRRVDSLPIARAVSSTPKFFFHFFG